MGTRSLTIIKDKNGNEILNLYRQYDGYPDGHGQDLANFLASGKLVNGLTKSPELVFNGMGCLAAQLVAHFKQEPGNFYIYPPGSRDLGEEYIYTVFPRNGKIWLTVQSGCMTFFGLPGTKQGNMNILFEGPVVDYTVAACELAEKQQNPPPNDFLESQEK